jgi:hypothetical protein
VPLIKHKACSFSLFFLPNTPRGAGWLRWKVPRFLGSPDMKVKIFPDVSQGRLSLAS